ncbi:transposase family protein [Streptomyces formicae]
MLIVTREGDRKGKLRPSQCAVVALAYLREYTTYAQLAAGCRISEGTARAHVQSVITRCASRAPLLPRALHRARPDYALVDGTIAECDRVGDREQDYSGMARRHGVNIQALTGTIGELIWYSPPLPGRTVDVTAARTQRSVTDRDRLRIPVLVTRRR